MSYRREASADVDPSAVVGDGSSIWQLAQVRENVRIGQSCIVGRGAYIGAGVQIGDNVKIQNHALVYEPALLEDGVFVGPAVVLTNDLYPRAVNVDGTPKRADDWRPVGVTVRQGASIGARAVCVAPLVIGRWSMVAAGSVVTKDVADYALVVGSPARQRGWVGEAGVPLEQSGEAAWHCPETGRTYTAEERGLKPDGETR